MKKTFKTLVFVTLGLLALASCEDVPAPYPVPDNGNGNGDEPTTIEVNCAQAIELTNALADGATSTETYTITGYITEVVGDVSRNQQTFWMADTKNGGRMFEAYWANLPEGVSAFTAGSKVKITGNLTKYVNSNTGKVTAEIKNPTVEILENGEGEDTPSGTEVTCAQAVELTNALADGGTSSETYTVTGYITEVVGSVSKNQQTFWMADTKNGGKVFEAYWANLPEGVSEFKTGMKVKITGNLMKYVKDGKVTPEIKNANVEILENGEGGDTPSGDAGTIDNPYTVAQALEIINAGTYTKDKKVYVSGIVSKIDEISAQYGNATYYISDDGKTDKQLQVFRGYTLDGEKFQSEDDLMVGDKVIVWGVLTLYNSKTPEITGSSATGDASSFNAADLGLTNGAAFDKVTYNGLTITTDGGGNNNTPKYYDSGSNLRMYPKNSITISAGKTISSITLTCYPGSVANGNVKASKGNVNVSDPTISITGINDKSVTITNNDGSTGAASQIRIVKFDITYAE